VLPGGINVLQVLVLLIVECAEHPLEQHLGEADDRVERRPQLVGHVGEELGLVAAGGLQLAALVLEFPEQPGILDRQDGLGGERLQPGFPIWTDSRPRGSVH
jgi:hypothetical protein